MMALVMELSGIGLEDDCKGCLPGGSCVGDGGALTIDSRLFGGDGCGLLALGMVEVLLDTMGKPHMLFGEVAFERGVSELPRGRPLVGLTGASLWLFRGFGGVGGRFSATLRFLGSADGGDCTSDAGPRTMAGGSVPDRREADLVMRVGLGDSTSGVDLLMT